MIRFLQTPGPIKKIVLGGLLTFISVMMAITLIPGIGSSSFIGSTPTKGVVATVSGQDITTSEVRNLVRNAIQRQYPRGGREADLLMSLYAGQGAQELINQKVQLVEARRLGLRVTNDEIREELEHGPYAATFFPGGKFIGQTEYEGLLQNNNLTVLQFEQSVAEQILMRKLKALVTGAASVSEAEVRQQFEKQNTKVKLDYAVFKKDDILKSLHPAEAELNAYYDRNKNSYVNSIPEKRQLKYVVIDNSRVLPETQVTQQDLQAYYDQHREEYRVPGQVNARQIIINKPLPGTDGKVDQKALDAARAKADDVFKQLKAGGNFADLAKKYSEDAGTAKNGGSLGWVRPDVFPDAAVKTAVASTAKGQNTDLVNASYAFVIVHVDDKQEAHMNPLDEVKSQIEPLIKQQKAAQAAQRQSDQVLNDARSGSLEKAATAKGLQVITTDFVSSKDILPGIGSDQQFMTTAFGQSQGAPPELVQLHQGYAVYQVTAIKPPSTPTFEEIKGRVEQEFKNERATQLLTQKTQELADRAKNSHDLKKTAKDLGAEYKASDFVLPDGQVPDIGSMAGQASVAFTLKQGEISGPINAGNAGAVLVVADRQVPTDQDFAAKKDQIRDSLVQGKRAELFGLYLSSVRDKMEKSGKVKINQAELQTLTKVRTEENE
jgi:peptidyl-prolyl cis-trans isomerase D